MHNPPGNEDVLDPLQKYHRCTDYIYKQLFYLKRDGGCNLVSESA